MTVYHMADEFTQDLGGRFRDDGDFSGEEFRDEILIGLVEDAIANKTTVTINFDGVTGMPTSFLEEAFGGMFRKKPNWDIATVDRALKLEAPNSPRLWGFVSFAQDAMKRAARGR